MSGWNWFYRKVEYIDPDTNEKFYIKRVHARGALNGDKVKISLMNYRGLYLRARVIEVAERRSRILNARLFKVGKQTYASLYPYQAKKIILLINSVSILLLTSLSFVSSDIKNI